MDDRGSPDRFARRGLITGDVADLVDALPDLVDALPPARAADAHRVLRARVMRLRKGRWAAALDAPLVDGGIGFVIVDGAVLRCVIAAHRTSGELLGPGDLLQPAHDLTTEPPFRAYFRALVDTRIALLDARFTRAAAAVPELVPALVTGITRRTGTVARQLVIVQSQAVDTRIVTTLRHLADRWGRVTVDGILMPEFFSQGLLALLLGARRPSVTSAFARLSTAGHLHRRADGRWVLAAGAAAADEPPAAAVR